MAAFFFKNENNPDDLDGLEDFNDGQNGKVESLTDREFEIFRLFGEGLRPRHIAEKLSISTGTIDTHCKNIRAKLQFKSVKDLITFATQWFK